MQWQHVFPKFGIVGVHKVCEDTRTKDLTCRPDYEWMTWYIWYLSSWSQRKCLLDGQDVLSPARDLQSVLKRSIYPATPVCLACLQYLEPLCVLHVFSTLNPCVSMQELMTQTHFNLASRLTLATNQLRPTCALRCVLWWGVAFNWWHIHSIVYLYTMQFKLVLTCSHSCGREKGREREGEEEGDYKFSNYSRWLLGFHCVL